MTLVDYDAVQSLERMSRTMIEMQETMKALVEQCARTTLAMVVLAETLKDSDGDLDQA